MASALPHLICCSFLILLLSATAQTYGNVSLGTSLFADDNLSWTSPSGDFAFGFRRLPGDGDLFVLAIWFAKVPNKTIVWTAKNGYPVPRDSKAELTTNGELVLKSSEGTVYWDAWKTENIENVEAAYGAMLDTGNFVIASKNSSYIWESFKYPTDTILPTQVIGVKGQLSSRGSENNYLIGRFELHLLDNGSLVLNQMDLQTKFPYAAYYVSNTSVANPNESSYRMVFNESGYIYIQIKNGSISNLTQANIFPPTEFYYRATLHFDGVFIQYSHPKTSHGNETWSRVWSIPDNICVATYSTYGSGPCGFNSYCKLGQDMRPSCGCPPGFSLLDPNDQFNGCKHQYVQECKEGRSGAMDDQFEIIEFPHADWPLTAYEELSPYTKYECRKSCLRDCFCVVAIFSGTKEGEGSCWKKRLPLSNGKLDKGVNRIALFKVLKPNASLRNPPHSVTKKNNESTLILSILLGGSALFNFLFVAAIFLIVFYMFHKKLLTLRQFPSTLETNPQSFTYKDLEEATDGFKEELGRGAFGIVYKGLLPSGFRNHVAVKKLDKVLEEGEKEFKTEVSVISQTHHKNLVRLLGFCDEGEHRLLVYEYMINGSLSSFLFGILRPAWKERLQIAFGIARGLMYLHEECSTQIIHCDIKPQNILLDESFTARISDFGLAKLLMSNQTRTRTGVRGTKGYVAPEWFRNKPVTVKVDVYSFGVMLLEIICCRKSTEFNMKKEEEAILVDWAFDCYRDGRLGKLVEDDEEARSNMKMVEKLIMVAIWCIQDEPSLRPSMKKVTLMLEGVVEVSAPPCPFILSSFS
ncbi:hypothetical protein HHK36_022339 [Tetracentron sinense]|uniref:Receptor-like serine/threonine-protein kinase n=1 Tax=Tetracentron sinense TaxID=13715 RepID=A0A835D9I2_TETSI|nr:hypothetical protein HHK36_022339 [Tetracentron sinense]